LTKKRETFNGGTLKGERGGINVANEKKSSWAVKKRAVLLMSSGKRASRSLEQKKGGDTQLNVGHKLAQGKEKKKLERLSSVS